MFSPAHIIAVDQARSRLDAAPDFGADVSISIIDTPVDRVRELTGGLGADVVIEAVGVPETVELCTELVRPGGHVATIGVHGKPATLHLESLWSKNVTITTGLVDTVSTPSLLAMLAVQQITTTDFVTHRFGINEMLEAYDVVA